MHLLEESISGETLLAILGAFSGVVLGAFGIIKLVLMRKEKNGNGKDKTKRLDTKEISRITGTDARLDSFASELQEIKQIVREVRAIVDLGDGKGGKLIYGSPLQQEAIARDLSKTVELLQHLVTILEN